MQYIGLDIGYGFVKVTDGNESYVFPSIIGSGHNKNVYRMSMKPDRLGDLRLVIDDQLYFVGKTALRHSRFAARDLSDLRSQGEELKVLFTTALSLFGGSGRSEFQVVTGLPPGRMYLADDMVTRFSGDFQTLVYRDRAYEEMALSVQNITVVPQPVGTFWADAFNSQSQAELDLDGRIGIIDIGFRTTDLAAIEDGEFIPPRSYTIPAGVSDTYPDIAEHIATVYGVERESFALDENIVQGQINVSGQPVDIAPIKGEAFKQLANKLLIEITSKWNVRDFDRLLLSGGGSQALGVYLLSQFPQAELVNNPSLANSRGYQSWAKWLWAKDPD